MPLFDYEMKEDMLSGEFWRAQSRDGLTLVRLACVYSPRGSQHQAVILGIEGGCQMNSQESVTSSWHGIGIDSIFRQHGANYCVGLSYGNLFGSLR